MTAHLRRSEAPEIGLRELDTIESHGDPVGSALFALRETAESRQRERPELWLRQLEPMAAEKDPVGNAIALLAAEPDRAVRDLPVWRAPRRAVAAALLRLRGSGVRQRPRWPVWIGVAAATAAASLMTIRFVPVIERVETPVAEVEGAPELRLAAALGDASVMRDGVMVPLQESQALQPGDRVVTGVQASLQLRVGHHTELGVDNFSDLEFQGMENGVPVVNVRAGRAEGHVGKRDSSPSVAFRHRGRRVRLLYGKLGVLRSSRKRIAVAAVGEAAIVEIDGRTLVLPPEHQIRVSEGGESAQPVPLPALALDLRQAQPLKPGMRKVTMTGLTNPDVLLIINKRPVAVGDSGVFTARVPVPQSRRAIRARVVDAAGRSREETSKVKFIQARWKWSEPG